MDYLRVRNWDKFQHYRDRNPPWIKLYIELLDDYSFYKLTDPEKWQLISLWILAAKCDNKIANDPVYIQGATRSSRKLNINKFIELGFVESWIEEEKAEWHSRYINKDIREAVIKSCNHSCIECGAKEHLEIDHIIPISRGGDGKRENLQVLCSSCNRRKRAKLSYNDDPMVSAEQLATQMRRPETEQRRDRAEKRGKSSLSFEQKAEIAKLQAEILRKRSAP